MAIIVACMRCTKNVNVPDVAPGIRLTCPHCKAALEWAGMKSRPANAPQTATGTVPTGQQTAAPSQQPPSPGTTCPECRLDIPVRGMIGAVRRGGQLVCPHCKASLIYPGILILRIVNKVLNYVGPLLVLVVALVCYSKFGTGVSVFIGCLLVVFGVSLTETWNVLMLRTSFRLASLRELPRQ